MNTTGDDYLDGNAAAGALSDIFAVDVISAEGQCAHCGATRRVAETQVFQNGPGLVMRCLVCKNVLMRMVNAGDRAFFEMRGVAYLCVRSNP